MENSSCHMCALYLPAALHLSPVVNLSFLVPSSSLLPNLSIPCTSPLSWLYRGQGAHGFEGVSEEERVRKDCSSDTSLPPTPSFSLNRHKHKHNWTCWKAYNGTGGGKVKSYSRHAWVPRSGGNQQHLWLLCLNPQCMRDHFWMEDRGILLLLTWHFPTRLPAAKLVKSCEVNEKFPPRLHTTGVKHLNVNRWL